MVCQTLKPTYTHLAWYILNITICDQSLTTFSDNSGINFCLAYCSTKIDFQQEAITGDVPHKERADLAVIHTVLVKKQHPVRPVQLIPSTSKVDELWELLERCWSYEPLNRPKVPEVRDFVSACMCVPYDSSLILDYATLRQ